MPLSLTTPWPGLKLTSTLNNIHLSKLHIPLPFTTVKWWHPQFSSHIAFVSFVLVNASWISFSRFVERIRFHPRRKRSHCGAVQSFVLHLNAYLHLLLQSNCVHLQVYLLKFVPRRFKQSFNPENDLSAFFSADRA